MAATFFLIVIAMSALSSFAGRSVESLAHFLRLKGFPEEIVECLLDNKVDGATFVKFTRDDLKDIFPTSFQSRKKIWDYLEDARNEESQISTASRLFVASSSDSERSLSPIPAGSQCTSERETPLLAKSHRQREKRSSGLHEEFQIVTDSPYPNLPQRPASRTRFTASSSDSERSLSPIPAGSQCASDTESPPLAKSHRQREKRASGLHEEIQVVTDSPYPNLPQRPASRMRFTASSSDSERSSSPIPGTQSPSGRGSPLFAKPCTQYEKRAGGSQSGSGTEPVIDIEEDYRFHVSAELRKCNLDGKYPDEKVLRRFIRDAAASLQAVAGDSISQSNFVEAAIKICQEVPILKDPRPACFPPNMKYPYWSTVLFLLKRRLQNIKGYEKRKTHGKTKRSSSDDVEFGEKEVEELHAQLLREVQSKKKNYAAIKEIQQNTFDFRRKDIEQMSDKSVVSEIISHYPFFQVHECTLLNELELYCKMKDGGSVTVESWEKNWTSLSVKVKNCLQSHELIPDDHETKLTHDDICGAFMEHVTLVDEKICSLPILNILPQVKSNVDEVIKKETKTNQPCLWCAVDEGMLEQIFLVVDKGIFFELKNKSYLQALLVLLGFYFAFNLSYDKRQDLIFQFVEEFVLGLRPPKKSVRYRTACMLLVPDK